MLPERPRTVFGLHVCSAGLLLSRHVQSSPGVHATVEQLLLNRQMVYHSCLCVAHAVQTARSIPCVIYTQCWCIPLMIWYTLSASKAEHRCKSCTATAAEGRMTWCQNRSHAGHIKNAGACYKQSERPQSTQNTTFLQSTIAADGVCRTKQQQGQQESIRCQCLIMHMYTCVHIYEGSVVAIMQGNVTD